MLKRARNWLVIALVAAIFGFTGLLQNTAMIAQSLFYLCLAFSIISVLFSLFEEEPESATTAKGVQVTSSVVTPAVVANVQSTAAQSLAA